MNAYVKRGKIARRPQIDAMISVLLKDGHMGSVKIENTDKLDLKELADKISVQINQSRKGNENETMQSKNIIAFLPWPLRSWLFFLYRKITIDWGLSLPFLGLNSNSFGSYVISNIATLGLESGYGALLPSSNVAFVVVIGGVIKKPVVVNDQIVPRKMMMLSVTLDHRVVDASHGGKLFRFVKYMIKHPELLENKSE